MIVLIDAASAQWLLGEGAIRFDADTQVVCCAGTPIEVSARPARPN